MLCQGQGARKTRVGTGRGFLRFCVRQSLAELRSFCDAVSLAADERASAKDFAHRNCTASWEVGTQFSTWKQNQPCQHSASHGECERRLGGSCYDVLNRLGVQHLPFFVG